MGKGGKTGVVRSVWTQSLWAAGGSVLDGGKRGLIVSQPISESRGPMMGPAVSSCQALLLGSLLHSGANITVN